MSTPARRARRHVLELQAYLEALDRYVNVRDVAIRLGPIVAAVQEVIDDENTR